MESFKNIRQALLNIEFEEQNGGIPECYQNEVIPEMNDLTPEQMHLMCKSLVPGDENKCTILHYATWQGIKD